MSTPAAPTTEAPRNATDRNITTATGIWHGHITLPSSLVTLFLIVQTIVFGYSMHLAFQEMDDIRTRLKAREATIDQILRNRFPEAAAEVSP